MCQEKLIVIIQFSFSFQLLILFFKKQEKFS